MPEKAAPQQSDVQDGMTYKVVGICESVRDWTPDEGNKMHFINMIWMGDKISLTCTDEALAKQFTPGARYMIRGQVKHRDVNGKRFPKLGAIQQIRELAV